MMQFWVKIMNKEFTAPKFFVDLDGKLTSDLSHLIQNE